MSNEILKAIAVDDEQHCLDTLVFELNRYCPKVELVQQIKDAETAIQVLPQADIDILFLDIHLQSMSGINLLESILPVDFDVIFVTAYDEYALKAFDLSAIHYLLKPVNGKKLKSAVDKVRQGRKDKLSSQNVSAMIETVKAEINNANKLAIPVQEGIVFVDPKNIMYIEGESNYSTIYDMDGKRIVVSKTLKYLEESILNTSFLRVHKSYIINISKLDRYVKADGGYVVLTDQKQIPVSRQRKHILNNLFK